MRKFVSIMFLTVLMAVLATGLAFAAVEGSPHDVTEIASALPGGTVIGTCSICHVPHKTAGAERLWAAQMGAIDAKGEVGALCYACHGSNGGYNLTTADAAQANDHVFPDQVAGVFPHRMWVAFAVTSDNTGSMLLGDGASSIAVDDMHQLSLATWTAQFPYLADGDSEDYSTNGANEIQCTSCHNVHDNTEQPFLRTNARDLCVACHMNRGGGGTRDAGTDVANLNGAWTGGTGVNNYGSHPVGTDVDGTLAGARTPFIGFGTGWFQAFESATGFTDATGGYTDGAGIWQLGRHAASTGPISATNDGLLGGVVCISCHAVHGVATENNTTGNTTVMLAVANLLGVAQTAIGVGNSDVANGNGDAANFLCETCHVQGNAGGWADATTWAASTAGAKTFGTVNYEQNDATAYTGANFPNPGGSSWSHPMDDAVVINPLLVGATFGINWPIGATNATSGVSVICESCHTPHPARQLSLSGIAGTVRDDVNAGAGAYILRDTPGDVCNTCHVGTGDTVINHHPVGTAFAAMTMTGTGAASTGTANSTTLNDSWGEDHRAAETLQILAAAPVTNMIGNGDTSLTCNDCHNSDDTNNGATATGAAHNWSSAMGGVGLDPNWDGDSKTCEDCHYIVNGGGLGETPAIAAGTSNVDNETANIPTLGRGKNAYNEFQELAPARATHFLGAISDNFWTAAEAGNISLGGSLTYAAFEGGVPVGPMVATGDGQHLICESCHSVNPKHNGGFTPGSGGTADAYVGGNNALLLVDFEEGRNESFNPLCEACHGRNPGASIASGVGFDSDAAKTHPLTLQGTSYRTGVLITAGSLGIGRGTLTITGNAFSAAAGQINCDSCHQPHSALTTSGTLILDAALATDAVGAPTLRGTTAGVGPTHPSGYDHENGERPEYQGFCQQCHAY